MRFGVASRLNAGLFIMIVLMMGGGALSLITTAQFRDGMDRVSGDYIPTLIGTSLLAQQSHSIVANAPSLAVADSDFIRRSVADRIADQGQALTELRERLRRHGVSDEELAGIDGLHRDLIDNLARLDAVVGQRIELNRHVQAMMARLIRLPTRLTAFATEDGRETPPLTAWMGDAQRAVGLMMSALGTPNGRRFEGLRQETAMLLDQLQRRTTGLPPGTITPASAILAEMRGVSEGDDGLFATQEQLAAVTATIQHLLLANRELSNTFVARVGAMARGVEARALGIGQGLSRDAARTGMVLAAAIAASLLAAAAAIAYINRNVVRRLVQVRDRVLSHVDGSSAPAAKPQRAADEIADIGAAMDFFLAEIARREEDLRTAKNAAEHALAELSRTQDSLIQAEKMAALGQLVAGVAHEINTPLGNALTSASYLADETGRIKQTFHSGPLRRADFDRYLSTATETGEILLANIGRAADLVHSFKQVAVDQSTDERRRFDLRQYLDEVVQSLKPAWRKGGHQVTVDCPPGIEIDGPPGAWSQTITNLVMNSLIHAYEEGQTGTLSIRAVETGGTVELTYADDGRGIPAANRDKVFDPFFTTRRGAGSTGLGLHIVFNLVTRTLGGRIDLEPPAPGTAGCRFRITAPLTAPADKHAAETETG
ncbi:signal transduction histidine kinase [Azospirillum fermentarium]|uniref:ATP-binding protein n=1 Tax=Azospirillum fermentarium TaxID=1233114 RepID=UPI00222806E5|nr:ATP-binding protein [Azospirillum fermentarium]MCW2245373.1 signal transduction histidine kinase [Azospirillum fermentarium]